MTRGRAPGGEGSVYQRESDGLWVAAVTLPGGRRKVRYGKTEREALRKRRDLLAEVEAGRPLPAGRTPTLGKYLEHWLRVRIASEVEAGHLRVTTADSYRQVVQIHVLPTPLAEVRLTALTPDDFRAWQRAKLREKSARRRPLSARTVGMAHAAVRRALNDAVRDGALARNVAALVPLPKTETSTEMPSEEEMTAVLAAMVDDKYRALWFTMLALGLRKGEGLALRWSQVDLDAGTVRIRKQILRERAEPNPTTGQRRGRLVEVDTKTPESKATMLLPVALTDVLKRHRQEQCAERMASRVWIDPDLVFTTGVGTALEPRNVNRAWAALCDRAAVRRLRVHDLRHAAASLAFADGASMKQIQEMLRHSRESTTSNIYVHLLDSVRRGTADTMDGVLRRLGG